MDDQKPEPAKLVDLTQRKQDETEAARARVARDFAEALRITKENRPIQLQLMAHHATEWFDRYQALKKAGFTPAEALQLCWRTP